jgi:hypothetical protein
MRRRLFVNHLKFLATLILELDLQEHLSSRFLFPNPWPHPPLINYLFRHPFLLLTLHIYHLWYQESKIGSQTLTRPLHQIVHRLTVIKI